MSDSSSDEESKERASQAKRPARKRRKLQPIEEGTSGVDDKASGVDGGGGILTEVSTDYGSKLRRAEKESYVKKSKLDMDAVKAPATRPRFQLISSSSSSEDEEPDNPTKDDKSVVPDAVVIPSLPRAPSPPRYHAVSKSIDKSVRSSLVEIQRVRRNLAAERLKVRRQREADYDLVGFRPCCFESDDEFSNDIDEEDEEDDDGDGYGVQRKTPAATSVTPTCDPGLRVKVLCLNSGVLRRVQMSPKDTFAVIYALMASAEGVQQKDLRLTLRESAVVVKPGDTYRDHGLTICDIVECVVVGKDASGSSAEAGPSSSNVESLNPHEISLNIQCPEFKTGQFATLKISRKAGFRALMTEFAASKGLEIEQLKFSFDGEKLDPESTPEDLDMEDGDCIDVVVPTSEASSSSLPCRLL